VMARAMALLPSAPSHPICGPHTPRAHNHQALTATHLQHAVQRQSLPRCCWGGTLLSMLCRMRSVLLMPAVGCAMMRDGGADVPTSSM
jgi:hypothetical protein